MNYNTSPIAFYPSRAAQVWRTWFAQRKISVICGNDILPFYIIDSGSAPSAGELYEPNTDTKVADITLSPYLLDHDIVVEGQSRHIWIYQGGTNGVFGYTNPGYYYLKIGGWYSDIFSIGDLPAEYTEVSWQFFDDIITADGTPISKHIKYKQIFDVPIWHPSYGIEEEGKTNNGIFFAMQQTTKKTSGFSTIVNEAQVDCLNLTRMADIITIKSCINGVTKTLQTNQFEITSKWESDDIASIDCQFDLFSIIRKYQQSNVEPEPLPIPVPPPPPSNYYIRGKATGTSIHMKINGTDTNIPVTNGEFVYAYDTPLTNIATYNYTETWDYPITNKKLVGSENITEIDFSESCGFVNAKLVAFPFMHNCTKANFTNCTFSNADNVNGFLFEAKNLTTLQLPDATFASIKMCFEMFCSCEKIVSISLPKATISYVSGPIDGHHFANSNSMFQYCYKLQSVSMPLSDFSEADSLFSMFSNCKELNTINMPIATFANVVDMQYMFDSASMIYGNVDWGAIFPLCVAQPVHIDGMFYNAKNIVSVDLTDLDMSAVTSMTWTFYDSGLHDLTMDVAQFASVTNYTRTFCNCKLSATTNTLLSTISFSAATITKEMFKGVSRYQSTGNLNLATATFENVTDATSMFEGADVTSIQMPLATFEKVTNANKMFYNAASPNEINMPSATFDVVTSADSIFLGCTNLTYLKVPDSSTWPLNFSLAHSPNLTVTYFVAIAKWVKDYSGGTAHSVTFNATAKSDWQLNHTATYMGGEIIFTTKNWAY